MYAQEQRNGLKLQRDERLFNMENSSYETAFFEACESGDVGQARELLKNKKIDPTKLVGMKTKEEGRTCLHLAVLAGNPELVKKLNQREFTNEGDNQGDKALHLAVWKYRVDLVTLLLDGKADLSVENNKGETPLSIAVKFGFLDIIEKFIEHEPEAVQKLCKEKKVLHLAVELKRVQIVEFLIRKSEIIKELINQRVEGSRQKPSDNETVDSQPNVVVEGSRPKPSDNETVDSQPNVVVKPDKETVKGQPIVGDTALHIAARNKNEPVSFSFLVLK